MALLRQQVDFSIRGQNKEIEWLDSYDDLFDQLVETNPFHLGDESAERSSSDDLTNFFDVSASSSGSDQVEISPIPEVDARRAGRDDAWHSTLRLTEQNPASSVLQGARTSIYPDSCGRAAVSDPELFSLDRSFPQIEPPILRSTPVSPILSPLVLRPRRKLASILTNAAKRSTSSGINKAGQRSSLSPSMMSPPENRHGYQGTWAKRFEAASDRLTLQFSSDPSPVSPPPSAHIQQEELHHYGFSTPHPLDGGVSPLSTTFSHHQMTPLTSPTFNNVSRSTSYHQPQTSSFHQAQLNNIYSSLHTPPATQQIPTTPWGHDNPEALEFAFSTSPDFTHKAEGWWSPPSVTQASPTAAYHRASNNLVGLDGNGTSANELATHGLMIQCGPSGMDGFPESSSSIMQSTETGYSASSVAFPGQQNLDGMSPRRHHHRHGSPPQQMRSPSASPPPLIRQRRASSKGRTHHRRKSSTTNGGSNARPVSVGFVNFTPDDSRKILTGVAPSGSSKTKARREKEAAEKRRRMSEAAKKAILDVGGDPTAVEREIWAMPEH
ncbi:hypothetical protein K402DRAFT_416234 [Aulographum hederae CBS 113979]|uniref:Uncharacterized protein n=1 Tax=Aulographum hederae CBS 113979 TaxID=1176131 RepID=A0A6G1HHN7_9PEZI|nr:hypothetical protein K402DRAFT_416234 [Aulographum hederae CBS 113979]